MSNRRIFALSGIAIVLAAIGAITSVSVVRAGGVEGGVYLTVNILLAAVGVALLVIGLRRRAAKSSERGTRPD